MLTLFFLFSNLLSSLRSKKTSSPQRMLPLLLLALLPRSEASYVLDATWPVDFPTFHNLSQVTAVAVAQTSSGTQVHVAQRGAVNPWFLVFDAQQGKLLYTWGNSSVIASPHGANSPRSSTLYVTDIVNGTILLFDVTASPPELKSRVGAKGSALSPVEFSAPADLVLTARGDLLVSDGDGGSNNRVLSLAGPDFKQVQWHVGGLGKGVGEFNSPHSVAYFALADVVVVADRDNNRIVFLAAATGDWLGEWDSLSCLKVAPNAAGTVWGVRVDNRRSTLFVADGVNGKLYVLSLPGTGWSAASFPSCAGALAQTLDVPAGATCKPHELAVDEESGAVYVVGVATPPVAVRFNLQGR
jgi:DNA-binding beta-propeller fold protein YncE